jgi:Flp pilus assembly protein TadG
MWGAKPWGDRRGTVAILAAVMLPVLIGVAGLVTEYGTALLFKMRLQRIADLAAYGGGTIYNATGSIHLSTPASEGSLASTVLETSRRRPH